MSILVDKREFITHSMGMAKCAWIYSEGDKLVKSGARQVGDQCNSDRATEATKGYCHGHYLSWCKVNNPERLRMREAKEKATRQMKQQEATETKAAMMETIKRQDTVNPAPVAKNPYGIDEGVLKAMGLLDKCNVEEEYALYKQLNLDAKQENYDEKMAYFRWQSTPEPWRTPATHGEVAKILGVSTFTLRQWQKSLEYEAFEKRDIERIVEKLKRPILYKVAEAAYRGDKGMTEIFNKYYVKKTDEKNEDNKRFPQISPEQVEEANKRAAEVGKERLQQMPMKLEKTHIMSAARDGCLSPNPEDIVN